MKQVNVQNEEINWSDINKAESESASLCDMCSWKESD